MSKLTFIKYSLYYSRPNIFSQNPFIFNQQITDSLPQVNANSLQIGDANGDGLNDLLISDMMKEGLDCILMF